MDKLTTVLNKHYDLFQSKPEITLTANGRANIIGEHTDYHDGFVFPFAINKGITFCASKNSNKENSIFSIDFDNSYQGKIEELGSWQSYLHNAILFLEESFKIKIEIKLCFGGDLPIGSGISSSSALCCGFIEVINQLYELKLNGIDKVNLASRIEHGTGVIGGKMDQYTINFGEEDKALLLDCRTLTHEAINVPQAWEFILINSGVKHNLAATEYNTRRREGESGLEKIKNKIPGITHGRDISFMQLEECRNIITDIEYKRLYHVVMENDRVLNFKNHLLQNNLTACGELLNESHISLRDLYEVSCEELDELFNLANNTSFIIGSRMMGGGFGGCTINLISSFDQTELENLLNSFSKKFGHKAEYHIIKPAKGIIIHD